MMIKKDSPAAEGPNVGAIGQRFPENRDLVTYNSLLPPSFPAAAAIPL